MSPYSTITDYDSGRDGQIASGATITLPTTANTWFDATGISHAVLRGAFAGGTTQVFVDQARDAAAGAAILTSADLKASVITDAGAVVPITMQYVRFRIVQTVAITTNAQFSAKGLAS